MIQGGDIYGDGSFGDSIYDRPFEDENFTLTHDGPGIVGLPNNGPNTNVSQFYITTVECHHLDNRNVVIGIVRKGLNIINEITEVPRINGDQPIVDCKIVDCGEIKPGDDFNINESDETEDIYPPWPDDFDLETNENFEEIISKIKNSGNYFFERENYIDSDRKYKKVLRYIDWINKCKYKHNCNTIRKLKVQTLLNLAAVRLNKQNYKDVIEICSQIIEIESKNVKAHYRRGQARIKQLEYDTGIKDLIKAQALHPNDPKILQACIIARKLKLEYLQREKTETLKNYFTHLKKKVQNSVIELKKDCTLRVIILEILITFLFRNITLVLKRFLT